MEFFYQEKIEYAQRDQYNIGQQTRALGCAVTKTYTCKYIPRIHSVSDCGR